MEYQWTVISEPSKGLFYPVWRDKEGDGWKAHTHTVIRNGKPVLESVCFNSRDEAIQFNKNQEEMVQALIAYNKNN